MSGAFIPELIPPARTFYEKELGKLTRPSRGWARANCPFHESKSKTSFSVNLDSGGGFCCFGCGAKGGDPVDFVRLRYKLDFRGACRELGCWRESGLTQAEKQQLDRERQERERIRKAEQVKGAQDRTRRLAVRDELHTAEKLKSDISARLRTLPANSPEAETCWEILQLLTTEIAENDRLYRSLIAEGRRG